MTPPARASTSAFSVDPCDGFASIFVARVSILRIVFSSCVRQKRYTISFNTLRRRRFEGSIIDPERLLLVSNDEVALSTFHDSSPSFHVRLVELPLSWSGTSSDIPDHALDHTGCLSVATLMLTVVCDLCLAASRCGLPCHPRLDALPCLAAVSDRHPQTASHRHRSPVAFVLSTSASPSSPSPTTTSLGGPISTTSVDQGLQAVSPLRSRPCASSHA